MPESKLSPQTKAVLQLLRRKIRPGAEYAGEQVTESSGGNVSRQRIRGDRGGRIRVDYTSPTDMVGDFLVIAPDQFRNYHRAANRLDIAMWPGAWSEFEKRIFGAIRDGRIQANKVGEEVIAGRNAAIVELKSDISLGGDVKKFWIDEETGIQLKNERSNARGLISRSYMTSITVGPAAGVQPRDFYPPAPPGARVNTLFPHFKPQFATVQEAARQLTFTPVEPATLPSGFHLRGVWVFNLPKGKTGALLRYTDNFTTFSLFQRPARPEFKEHPAHNAQGQRNIQRWRVPAPTTDLEVVYIGTLTPEQAEALHTSLR